MRLIFNHSLFGDFIAGITIAILLCWFLMPGQIMANDTMIAPAFADLKLSREDIIIFPPGDLGGIMLEPDGITPHVNREVVLLDPAGGLRIKSVTTCEKGFFLFSDIKEGDYGIHEGIYVLALLDPGINENVDSQLTDLPGIFDLVKVQGVWHIVWSGPVGMARLLYVEAGLEGKAFTPEQRRLPGGIILNLKFYQEYSRAWRRIKRERSPILP